MQQKGLYLYAVRPVRETGVFPKVKGIDGKNTAFALKAQDTIEAIVSIVAWREFSKQEIIQKAQDDLPWIKEKSLIHNEVIMQSIDGTDGAIVPMKFGSIFRDKASLLKTVRKNSKKILSLFKKLRGKEEWSVKVFAKPGAVEKEIINNDPLLRSRSKELVSLPVGLAYFKEKELEEEVEKRKSSEFQRWAEEILNTLPYFAEEVKLGKILDKELTARSEPMILNAILLISKTKLSRFYSEVERCKKDLRKRGLIVTISGPWPPYSFI